MRRLQNARLGGLTGAALLAVLGVTVAAEPPVDAQTAISVDGVFGAGGLKFPDGTVQTAAAGPGVAPAADTGQQICYDPTGSTADTITCGGTGQDGEKQAGADWPAPRFSDNQDGTVTDNLTGLIWLQDAGCLGQDTFQVALLFAGLTAQGVCGLNDGSSAGAWRLPSLRELLSLVDYGEVSPALAAGHPFSNVQSTFYWSATSSAALPTAAWGVLFGAGNDSSDFKNAAGWVWAVRGGI